MQLNRLLITAFALFIGCIFSSQAFAEATGEVLTNKLNMRSGPGAEYPVIKLLPQGAKVIIESEHMDWLSITHEGTQGFILHDDELISVSGTWNVSTPIADEKKIKELSNKAETISRQLQTSQNELDAMTAEEQKIINEFNTLERTLNETRSQVRGAHKAIEQMQAKIEKNQLQYMDLESRISTQEIYAAQRLVALYKLSWLGRIHFLASATSFFDFIQRKTALEYILDSDTMILEEFNDNKVALEALLEQLNTSKTQKQSLEMALKKDVKELEKKQRKRTAILDRIKNEKKLQLAAVESLEKAARDLNIALEMVRPSAQIADTPSHTTVGIDTAVSDIPDDSSFASRKGLLSWPVQGKVVSFFGSQKNGSFNVATFQSGINIQAERGEPIRSVAAGYTIFSSWFNGFGNMIIIDHGDHYYTVYAHLEESFKFKGDRVEKGEVIATVGDSDSLAGPALHFEVRHHGTPTDPLLWMKND